MTISLEGNRLGMGIQILMDSFRNTSSILYNVTSSDVHELYSVEHEIGRGSFGTVHACVCKRTGQRFACKIISKEKLKRSQDIIEVQREVEILQTLRDSGHHPNVVSMQGVFEDTANVYIVMELCEQGELYDHILQHSYMQEEDVRSAFHQLVLAVQFVHSHGILHRDLKPENILLCSKGLKSKAHVVPTVKLADFGLAVFLQDGQEMTGRAGSRLYEAPELMCNQRYGYKADSWSLGVVLYAMLSGRLPFMANDKATMLKLVQRGKVPFDGHPWHLVSKAAKKLILRLLHVDPKQRASMKEVLKDPWLAVHCEQVSMETPLEATLSNETSGSPCSSQPSQTEEDATLDPRFASCVSTVAQGSSSGTACHTSVVVDVASIPNQVKLPICESMEVSASHCVVTGVGDSRIQAFGSTIEVSHASTSDKMEINCNCHKKKISFVSEAMDRNSSNECLEHVAEELVRKKRRRRWSSFVLCCICPLVDGVEDELQDIEVQNKESAVKKKIEETSSENSDAVPTMWKSSWLFGSKIAPL